MAGTVIMGSQCTFVLTRNPGITGAGIGKLMTEVERFDGEWVPDIHTSWPAGAPRQRKQLIGGFWRVTMDANTRGGGFGALAQAQQAEMDAALNANRAPSFHILTLTRKWIDPELGPQVVVYNGGTITQTTDSNTTGNAPLTSRIIIEFEWRSQ